MKLPNFFVVGAAKAGTTTLYHCFKQHPEIFVPSIKETFYFAGIRKSDFPGPGSHYYGRGIEDWDDYIRLFKDCGDEKAIGEICTAYLYFPGTAERIYEKLPHARIIIMLRNPIDRAYSNYLHHVRDGIEPLSFEEALKMENERKRCGYWWGFRYVEVGFYYNQVKRYIDRFGRERVAIYLFEEFSKDPRAVLKSMFEFLGVDSRFMPHIGRYNVTGRPRIRFLQRMIQGSFPMKRWIRLVIPKKVRHKLVQYIELWNLTKDEMRPETRYMLSEIYKEDILKLEELIGLEVSKIWLKKKW